MIAKNVYAYRFDWGHITAEAYSESKNEVVLIFNCDLRNQVNINNVIQYVIGRICWGCINFPEKAVINVTFDIRGQEIIVSKSKQIKEGVLEKLDSLGVINNISVDFLR